MNLNIIFVIKQNYIQLKLHIAKKINQLGDPGIHEEFPVCTHVSIHSHDASHHIIRLLIGSYIWIVGISLFDVYLVKPGSKKHRLKNLPQLFKYSLSCTAQLKITLLENIVF